MRHWCLHRTCTVCKFAFVLCQDKPIRRKTAPFWKLNTNTRVPKQEGIVLLVFYELLSLDVKIQRYKL